MSPFQLTDELYLYGYVCTGDHIAPDAFRPELVVRVGRRQRLRAALQGIRDEGGDEHRGGFSLVV